MIKLRQRKIRLQSLVTTLLSSMLLLVMVAACDDDEGLNTTGEVLYIDGPSGVSPESTQLYTAGEFGGTINWTIDGNASFTDAVGITKYEENKTEELRDSGEIGEEEDWTLSAKQVLVDFTGVGSANIAASGSGFEGAREITINAVEFSYGVEFPTGSTINEDGVKKVSFTFSAPLAAIPELVLNGTVAGDTSVIVLDEDGYGQAPYTRGSLTTLTEVGGSNMTAFEATYTATSASEKGGQLEGYLNDVLVSDTYGGASEERLYFLLHSIDNVSPIGTFAASTSDAKDGTEITFTMTLNEAANANGDDMIVDLTVPGTAATQVMLSASGDAAVWSGSYTISAGSSEGVLTAVLDASTVIDAAGNAPIAGELGVNAAVTIDNTAPIPACTFAEDPADTRLVKISPISDTDAESVQWIWLPYNSQFEPTSASDFEGEGKGTSKFVVGAGAYKIWYMEVDAAGNASSISRYPVLTGDQVDTDIEAAVVIQ